MKSTNLSRRSVLARAGHAAAGFTVGQLLSVARAQEAAQARQGQPGGLCLSMVFDDGSKVKFDTENYVKDHLPLLREVYGDSVERIEVLAAPERDPKALITAVPVFAGIAAPRCGSGTWRRSARSWPPMPSASTSTWRRCHMATGWCSRTG